ncbi:MAG: hypothetical protein KKA07_10600 [Bacteroidetes bacterium]|nr:hypothetical protein [Bacteroidota bacterium]MBU1719506.1 hypothetical protein [Bacteroidota bacterium]
MKTRILSIIAFPLFGITFVLGQTTPKYSIGLSGTIGNLNIGLHFANPNYHVHAKQSFGMGIEGTMQYGIISVSSGIHFQAKEVNAHYADPFGKILFDDDWVFIYGYTPVNANLQVINKPIFDVHILTGIITGHLLKAGKTSRIDGSKSEGYSAVDWSRNPWYLCAGFWGRYKMSKRWSIEAGTQIRRSIREQFPSHKYRITEVPEESLSIVYHVGIFYSFGKAASP